MWKWKGGVVFEMDVDCGYLNYFMFIFEGILGYDCLVWVVKYFV